MGQAALFTPPPIHSTNMVIFPKILRQSRLRQFIKSINGQTVSNEEGLITVVNDGLEFHYKIYHRHLELVELTAMPSVEIDAVRCIEFLKYESYLLQRPIYCVADDSNLVSLLSQQGFRLLNEEEAQETVQELWGVAQKQAMKVSQ